MLYYNEKCGVHPLKVKQGRRSHYRHQRFLFKESLTFLDYPIP